MRTNFVHKGIVIKTIEGILYEKQLGVTKLTIDGRAYLLNGITDEITDTIVRTINLTKI